MRISPIDIQQQQFKSRPFGYEKSGVDRFLESLSEELERLMRENQDLREELARTNATLVEMREREGTLKETLITTQKLTEQLKSTTRREVDVMMAEAEIKAERIMHNAENRRIQLIEEIQEIKRQKIDFETGLRGLLERHVRMLELNSMAIESQSADSKLLEEPLPFTQEPTLPEAATSHTVEKVNPPKIPTAQPQPKVAMEQLKPKVATEQPQPKVATEQPKPKVATEQPKLKVSMEQPQPNAPLKQSKSDVPFVVPTEPVNSAPELVFDFFPDQDDLNEDPFK